MLANGRRAITLAVGALRTWIRGTTAAASNDEFASAEPQQGHKTLLDRLIDGDNVTITGFKGEELGYLFGFMSRRIDNVVRMLLLTDQVPRLELEVWNAVLKDKSKELPDEVTMIYWEGLPLAVWCPAGHLKEFSFNLN